MQAPLRDYLTYDSSLCLVAGDPPGSTKAVLHLLFLRLKILKTDLIYSYCTHSVPC